MTRLLARALARLIDPFLPPRLTTREMWHEHKWREPLPGILASAGEDRANG